jgi:uncharacterized protein YijF (DUF1287 family)
MVNAATLPVDQHDMRERSKRRTMAAIGLIALTIQIEAAEPWSPALIAQAAREQIGKTVRYDPSYQRLTYPGGDVPMPCGSAWAGICNSRFTRT